MVVVDENIINNLYALLTPVKYPYKLVRYGRNEDGGYVIPESVCKVANALVTFGVGGDISFENDFIRNNPTANVTCYDGTITHLPDKDYRITYLPYNIGGRTDENVTPKVKGINDCITQDHTVLKIDIEGHEDECLTALQEKKFAQVDCLVIELHFQFYDGQVDTTDWYSYKRLCDLLYKIEKHMSLVHIHGHNAVAHIFLEDGRVDFPMCLECTFVSNRLIDFPVVPNKNQEYPIAGLDYPVCPNVEGGDTIKTPNGDIRLTWINL